MRASIVDLRYRMKNVLKAVERKEAVDVYSHGKLKARIVPLDSGFKPQGKVRDHPYFGMIATDESESVEAVMQRLRGARRRAL